MTTMGHLSLALPFAADLGRCDYEVVSAETPTLGSRVTVGE